MSHISLRRLLSKLTALALSTAAIPAVDAKPAPPDVSDDADADADLDASLTLDHGCLDPRDAGLTLGRGLASALDDMRPLTATHLAATWALSDDPVRRLALAHALEWTFPLVGDAIVIDHLSRDTDPQIRAATARAAWVRRAAGGDVGVLARLAEDPDPEVRSIARSSRP